ncbi:MAG: 16S rRNA (guanine(966)-N(2))-methyltransferase RsmD [bacterium]|nr:16S rRNA (guanine(966)-N(2))-methyltransferase RsmD [bacterium]
MRVVAGRWRGRRLNAPRGDAVRPTTDRVKEAVFSILGPDVADARVADLCCGAGSLGIEALSRGAAYAVFVDRDRRSLTAVQKNLEACGADPAHYRLVASDAAAWLEDVPVGDGPWLVLADPPYGVGVIAELAGILARRRAEGVVATVVLEHDRDDEPRPAGWDADSRRYGESHITILRPGAGDVPEDAP